MYLFIATIFIAELIIAVTVINFLAKLDKKVNDLNCCVEAFNPLAETCLQYARCLTTTFRQNFDKFVSFVSHKRKQIFNKLLILIGIYIVLFLFRAKSKKYSNVYHIAGVIQDIAGNFLI